MSRREFTRDVYAAIVRRATNAHGHVVCEGCGLVLGKKPYEVDHTIADALILSKRKLTVADGNLLGKECCHGPKSKADQGIIAQAKRREARNVGITKPSGKFQKAPKPEKTSSKQSLAPRRLFA